MSEILDKVISGQRILADTVNKWIRVINESRITSVGGGLKMTKTPNGTILSISRGNGDYQKPADEFLFINKLSLYYNPTSESYEMWIYAPSGHPSLLFPDDLTTSAIWGSYFGQKAFIDDTLTRDGDWVNTGLGLGSVWAYIEVGTSDVVKFASDHSSSWDSASITGDGVPNVQLGVTRYTGDAPWAMNYVFGVVGVFSAISHSAIQFDSEP